MDDVAELAVGALSVVEGFIDEIGSARPVGYGSSRKLQRDDGVDKALLGAVVHVALQAGVGSRRRWPQHGRERP